MKLYNGSTNLNLLLKRRKISVKLWAEVNKIYNFETLNEVLKREDYYLENSLFEEITKLFTTEIKTETEIFPPQKPIKKNTSFKN